MLVRCIIDPQIEFPRVAAGHKLAWYYFLDEIFSDASSHGVSELTLTLPQSSLEECANLSFDSRAASSHKCPASLILIKHTLCGTSQQAGIKNNVETARTYVLSFGPVPPCRNGLLPNRSLCTPEIRLSAYTLRSAFWGLSMRLSLALRRADWADRLGQEMRRTFCAQGFQLAFYYLYVSGEE